MLIKGQLSPPCYGNALGVDGTKYFWMTQIGASMAPVGALQQGRL